MTTALPAGWTTRRPTLDDVPAILALVHASDIAAVGEPDCSADDIREVLTEPHTDPATGYDDWRRKVAADPVVRFDEWFVAEIDGEPAGVLQSAESDAEGWVRNLAVLRAYRNRGLGQALLRRAFAAYARRGLAKVGLGVDLANPTHAARLYFAVGMTPLYRADIFQTEI